MFLTEPYAPWAPPTPETKRFNERLSRALKDLPPPWEVDLELARRVRAEGKGVLPIEGPLDGARWVETPLTGGPADLGPRRVRLIEAAQPKGVYIHIHGGGWTFGSPDQFDGRNLELSRAAGVSVVAPQYRLSPEHRWPGCLEDCLAGTLWALDYAASRGAPVVIGGESAGGHLTAWVLLRLRDMGRLHEVRGAVLGYGAFDLAGTPSCRNWGPRNFILSTPIVRWFADNLLGGADPVEASPLNANLQGMPTALFFIGDEDPLLDDSLFMAQRWRAAGGLAKLDVWPGAAHAFDCFVDPAHQLPIAQACRDRVAHFVREVLARSSAV